jgi:hypothetical protein
VSSRELYRRWIDELWAGEPVADEVVSADFVGHWPDHDVHGPDELAATISKTRAMLIDLTFSIELGPLVDGEYVAGRWSGEGKTAEGSVRFFGNDILRYADGKFVEYWTGTSSG